MDSDNEMESKEHQQLVDNILNLSRKQYIGKPTRTEPVAEVSEYNLVKPLSDNKDIIKLYELTQPLKKRAVDTELRKQVKKLEAKSKTLSKPLEKPQAERIRRSVAYENTKKQLDRWEPVVSSNRVSTHLSFPLKDSNFDFKEANDFTSNWVLKSDLQKQLEKLEPKPEIYEIDTETKVPMTLQEMTEKRKEMAKLRQFQHSKELKARWQNKIKSKKYRRIHRKEKIKEQMKEFELLQKTNPEEALKKLDEIEKARAEERASLRHKSTGKWAKNQQVRAKYDKESRKVLAEQLAISKDLMQKQQLSESSNSEDEADSDVDMVNGIKVSKEVAEFVSGYRQFYDSPKKQSNVGIIETNNASENKNTQNNNTSDIISASITTDINKSNAVVNKIKKKSRKRNVSENSTDNKEKANDTTKKAKKVRANNTMETDSTSATWEVTIISEKDKPKRKNTSFEVAVIEDNITIDDIFDDIELKIKRKADKKFMKIKSKLEDNPKVTKKNKLVNKKISKESKDKEIEPVKENTKYASNRELPEKIETPTELTMNAEIKLLKSIIAAEPPKVNPTKNINPNVLKNTKHKLESGIPDLLSFDDNEESAQKGIAADAFEDDDLAEDFAKDKNDEIEKNKPKDIDLSLPGWGSWGGHNITVSNRKKKRFMVKFPKELPRKDMNKGDLIINESANDNIKPHLVNEVPFPFKTVKDFEASVRAPIGNTFVPETAFRNMIKPMLTTKMGTIIEPMTEDVLLHREQKKRSKRK